jgi:pimeloyl-ACP methyl ester carboxylesterase
MNFSSKSVVFITGTFISNSCWEDWIFYFESEGFHCIAPAWPHKEASAEELRNRPATDAIALNSIISVTDYFAAIIADLPEKPILVGHSLGGLVVQLLLQRELGIAGVAIHSFPPQGINRFRFAFVKALWQSMMLFTPRAGTYLMSFKKWKYVIANGLSSEKQKQTYYDYAIPESKKIIRDTFKSLTKIDFKKHRPPLLFTSGSNDKLIPASLNYNNFRKYSSRNAITNYKEFNEHTHLVFGVMAWKKEADFILYWLEGIRLTIISKP